MGSAESTTNFVSGVHMMAGQLFSNCSKVERHSLSMVPLNDVRLWIWMTHFEWSLDLRNAKVSCAPWAVIGSSSSMAKIQKFLKCSVGMSFLHRCRGGTWRRIGMLCESSSFMMMINGADLWIKGRVKFMLSHDCVACHIFSYGATFPLLTLQSREFF